VKKGAQCPERESMDGRVARNLKIAIQEIYSARNCHAISCRSYPQWRMGGCVFVEGGPLPEESSSESPVSSSSSSCWCAFREAALRIMASCKGFKHQDYLFILCMSSLAARRPTYALLDRAVSIIRRFDGSFRYASHLGSIWADGQKIGMGGDFVVLCSISFSVSR
jgi:hypothetical protein